MPNTLTGLLFVVLVLPGFANLVGKEGRAPSGEHRRSGRRSLWSLRPS
jgi:hypothetical protein